MSDANPGRLILFTRFPVLGKVKTRLIPALGPEGAAALQRRLTLRALRLARTASDRLGLKVEVHFEGGDERAMRHWIGDSFTLKRQAPGDLGNRMAEAFQDSFNEGSPATVIMGADCPELSVEIIESAFQTLTENRAVLGPANDGGYYLIGLGSHFPQLFEGIEWGSETVLDTSLKTLEAHGIQPSLLAPLDDLDRPEDLANWQRIIAAEESDLGCVTVIIPALNEAAHIASAIDSAQQASPHEIIVVDGGSSDDTQEIAREQGATVLQARPGRASQMNVGALKATGNTLLFLHADTLLPRDWITPVSTALHRSDMIAGAFAFRVAGTFRGRWIIETTTNLRCRWFQMPYGDQALCLRRAIFEELGGFADMPIMEDYELVHRLRRRGRIVTLREAALTSGRRWRDRGALRTTLTNTAMIAGYSLGVPLDKLARLYRGKGRR